jgi:vesicle-fusing ATPase
MKITMDDFELAFDDVKPAFGQHEEDLDRFVRHGIVEFNYGMKNVLAVVNKVVGRLVSSRGELASVSDIASLLIRGIDGSGKSALACDTARRFGFPFVRVVSSDNFVGMSESSKVGGMAKIFDDAYKTRMSCIILDDLERLCEFVPIGPRFSNTVLQALMVLVKRPHPKPGSKLQIIATCHEKFIPFLEEVGLMEMFTESVKMPLVENGNDAIQLVTHAGPSAKLNVGDPSLSALSAAIIAPLPIKQVLMFAEGEKQARKPRQDSLVD